MFLGPRTPETQFQSLHLHSVCGATLFGSHPRHWQRLVGFGFRVQRVGSTMQNLRRVGKNSDLILSRLFTKVHEIFRRCRKHLVLSKALIPLSMSRFDQKIFAIKSRHSLSCHYKWINNPLVMTAQTMSFHYELACKGFNVEKAHHLVTQQNYLCCFIGLTFTLSLKLSFFTIIFL